MGLWILGLKTGGTCYPLNLRTRPLSRQACPSLEYRPTKPNCAGTGQKSFLSPPTDCRSIMRLMSKKLNWAINIGLLVLIIGILFSPWVNLVFAGVFFLAMTIYFVVQLVQHRGGNEQSRFQWSRGPAWLRRFAADDFSEPKKQSISPPSSPKR